MHKICAWGRGCPSAQPAPSPIWDPSKGPVAGASWFALKSVPDCGGGGGGGPLGHGMAWARGLWWFGRPATSPSDPSGRGPGILDLFIFYNWNFVAFSRGQGRPETWLPSTTGDTQASCSLCGHSHFCWDLFIIYNWNFVALSGVQGPPDVLHGHRHLGWVNILAPDWLVVEVLSICILLFYYIGQVEILKTILISFIKVT